MSELGSMVDFLHANLVMNNVLECASECRRLTLCRGVIYKSTAECAKQMGGSRNAHVIALVGRDHRQD